MNSLNFSLTYFQLVKSFQTSPVARDISFASLFLLFTFLEFCISILPINLIKNLEISLFWSLSVFLYQVFIPHPLLLYSTTQLVIWVFARGIFLFSLWLIPLIYWVFKFYLSLFFLQLLSNFLELLWISLNAKMVWTHEFKLILLLH